MSKNSHVWIVALLGGMVSSHANLVGYWPLDDLSGGTTPDMVGGNNGTLQDTGAVTSIAGPGVLGGNGASFNGTANAWISTGATAATLGYTAPGASRTVSFWGMQNAYNDGGFFDQGRTGVNQQNYALRTINGTTNLRAQYWGGGDHDFAGPANGTWNHYSISYDGEVTTVYMNGLPVSREVQSTPLDTADDYGIRMGIWRTSVLDGAVDDLAAYNSSLPHESIVQLSRGVSPTAVAASSTVSTLTGNTANPGDGWAIREVYGNGTIGSLSDGLMSLLDSGSASHVNDYISPTINFHDSGGSGKIAGGTPFAVVGQGGGPTLGNVQDLVFVGKARLQISATDTYTFMHTGDDGFMLRLWDANGPLNFDAATDADILQGGIGYEDPTGVVDRFGQIDLAAGTYAIEYVGFERAGGATFELMVANGAKTAFDGDFALLSSDSGSTGAFLVPEPSMIGLIGLGALGLMLSRRRR